MIVPSKRSVKNWQETMHWNLKIVRIKTKVLYQNRRNGDLDFNTIILPTDDTGVVVMRTTIRSGKISWSAGETTGPGYSGIYKTILGHVNMRPML